MASATPDKDGAGGAAIRLVFTRDGARKLEAATRKLDGRRMAIVFMGRVESAPIVMGSISGGEARIALGASNANATADAESIARKIRAVHP